MFDSNFVAISTLKKYYRSPIKTVASFWFFLLLLFFLESVVIQ